MTVIGLIEDSLYNLISIYTNNQHDSEKERSQMRIISM